MKVIYSFSCTIYWGQNQVIPYHKTLSPNITFTSLNQIEECIKQCELWHLNLDDEEVWSKAYLPAVKITDNFTEFYKGRSEFRHIQVRLISSKEPLLGCSPLLDWLCKKRCIYAVDNTKDNLCIWQCLVVANRIRSNKARPGKDTMRDALKLVCEFSSNPKLRVSDVRPTKLVDFENITSRFQVNIRLYESINNSVWWLVFGQMLDTSIASS